MVMPRLQPAEIPQPTNRALDFTAPLITSQLPSILEWLLPFRYHITAQLNSMSRPCQRRRNGSMFISPICNDALGAHSRTPSLSPRHAQLRFVWRAKRIPRGIAPFRRKEGRIHKSILPRATARAGLVRLTDKVHQP